jgi:hypothetical protein
LLALLVYVIGSFLLSGGTIDSLPTVILYGGATADSRSRRIRADEAVQAAVFMFSAGWPGA